MPLVAGGSDRHKENFCLACFPCNKAKAQLIMEYLGDLEPDALRKKFAEAYEELNRGSN